MREFLKVRDVTRKFGGITAVDNISFEIDKGEVLGFLGPNGAGKTTTMRMITGYLEPSGGSISVCGIDMSSDPDGAKRHSGYLPEGVPLYPELTPRLFMNFIGNARGLNGKYLRERLEYVTENLMLDNVMDQAVETLSKGFRRRVAFAQALLHDPDLLILDEPTDGLDPNQKQVIRRLLREISPEKSIIISTHNLEEVAALCNRVIIISKGAVITDGTPSTLRSRHRYHNAVSLDIYNMGKETAEIELRALPGVRDVEISSAGDRICSCLVIPENSLDISGQLISVLKGNNIEFGAFSVLKGNMEEVFRDLTYGESSSGAYVL